MTELTKEQTFVRLISDFLIGLDKLGVDSFDGTVGKKGVCEYSISIRRTDLPEKKKETPDFFMGENC